MNHFTRLSVLVGVVFCLSSAAWALAQPTKPPARRPVPFPKVTCANVFEEIAKLKKMAAEHNQSVAAFMDDVIVAMDKWHQDLSPLEGKSVSVPQGQFDPIKRTVSEVSEVQGMVWDDLGLVDQRFDELLEVLPSCLK